MNQENFLCPLCERYPDTQEHIGQCQVLQDVQPLHTPQSSRLQWPVWYRSAAEGLHSEI